MSERFDRLAGIMERLRTDCPWDRQQTRDSIKHYLIEEAYEVLEAIEEKDRDNLKEELGDLLFQVIFHSQIAKETGEFDIEDVLENCAEKMIRRHPHVFGDAPARDAKEVLTRWEELKKNEKEGRSILSGIPKQLPALLRAHRVQEKAARVGFDWEKIEAVIEKVKEEVEELERAISRKNQQEIDEELGDLLFSLVNLSRWVSQNPEESLRHAIERFSARFHLMEEMAKEQGRSLAGLSLQEMDTLWEKAKKTS